MIVWVGINGFSRMGRLGLRVAWGCEELARKVTQGMG